MKVAYEIKQIVPDTKTMEMDTIAAMATEAPTNIKSPIFVLSILFETWPKLDWVFIGSLLDSEEGLCPLLVLPTLMNFFEFQRFFKPFKIVSTYKD